MSQITLDQLDIIDRLRAAEEACREVEDMIGARPKRGDADQPYRGWAKGREEGHTLERAAFAREGISRLMAALQIRMSWDIPDNRPDDYSPEVLAEQDRIGGEL